MDRIGLVCRYILERPQITQRELAQELRVSLGTVNRLVKECEEAGLIETAGGDIALSEGGENRRTGGHGAARRLTGRGLKYLEPYRMDCAVILAAGFGSRFVPLTFETPKGLLEVFGERMIERQIRQLHEAGVTDITIVVGYLKEKFEYLIDKYGVKLLYNPEYASRNNLASVYHARKIMEGRNVYLLASDHWMRDNLFHAYECGSWYSAAYMEGETSEWCFTLDKKGRVLDVTAGGRDAWVMYGPACLSKEFLARFLPVLEIYYQLPGTEQFYWEHVCQEMLNGTAARRCATAGPVRADAAGSSEAAGDSPKKTAAAAAERKSRRLEFCMPELYANFLPAGSVYEFENLEELRGFDPKYKNRSDNEALELVARVFGIPEGEIRDIRCVKAGMTNQSFLFRVEGKAYICRIPGPGTGLLINRRQEAAAFEAVKPLGISEHVVYFDPETGYKISEYYEGSRNADPESESDMGRCMEVLRRLHGSGAAVEHAFDIRERIDFYEKLCLSMGEIPFDDYKEVRAHMAELMDLLDELCGGPADPSSRKISRAADASAGGPRRPKVLAHVDSVADNFIFLPDGQVKLIDLEYAGMCDPLIDVAMCAIYSYYDEGKMDWLIRLYLQREPTEEEQTAVYAFAALGGFLWSLWTVYKHYLGQEFGEYSIIMYRYAKRYYRRIFQKN